MAHVFIYSARYICEQSVTNFVDGASIAAGSSDGCVYICSHVNKEDGSKSWEFKGKFKVSKLENTQINNFLFFKVCFAVCFVVDSVFFVDWLAYYLCQLDRFTIYWI